MKSVYYRKPLVREYQKIRELRIKVRSITHGKKFPKLSSSQLKVKGSINNPNDFWRVACSKKGKIVGYIHARIENNKEGLIVSLFILPEYQGLGIGRNLMKLSVNWFKRKKIKIIKLSVVLTNINAINFYKKFGFKEEDVVKTTYKDHLNRMEMYFKVIN